MKFYEIMNKNMEKLVFFQENIGNVSEKTYLKPLHLKNVTRRELLPDDRCGSFRWRKGTGSDKIETE
ncbi:MAG TPA: hypothetical protein H9934_09785 [Candidatus Anaerobutyricum faecale]|uniref:hypothetical protein n=1 Tax=Eubacterium sp. An11 TaxID=1965542 RepID=UPI00111CE48C|nr:hypothetical protein [Eubacterium sp. An11]HJC32404.1 hypothetical protein [Candidatus Anaerobutyricum faecale]